MTDLVQLLMDASGDEYPEQEDVELVQEAERWMLANGWQQHWRMGFVNERLLTSFREDDVRLMVCPKSYAGGFWSATGATYQMPNMAAALNLLVVLGLIPDRFSTIRRQALESHAKVCERAADRVEEESLITENAYDVDRAGAVAEGLRQAAVTARRMHSKPAPA